MCRCSPASDEADDDLSLSSSHKRSGELLASCTTWGFREYESLRRVPRKTAEQRLEKQRVVERQKKSSANSAAAPAVQQPNRKTVAHGEEMPLQQYTVEILRASGQHRPQFPKKKLRVWCSGANYASIKSHVVSIAERPVSGG